MPASVDPLGFQVGGSHYSSAQQPIEFIVDHAIPACRANVVKYLTRYKRKEGLEDLRKAAHYLALAETLGEDMRPLFGVDVASYSAANGFGYLEHKALEHLHDPEACRGYLSTLIEREEFEIGN